jgi:hypothetical protein
VAEAERERITVVKADITLFEWGRPNYQRVVVPWTVIADQDDAEAFANAVALTRPRT